MFVFDLIFHSVIDTVGYERQAGTVILENCDNIKVNLTKPKTLIRTVAYGNEFYFTFCTAENFIMAQSLFHTRLSEYFI